MIGVSKHLCGGATDLTLNSCLRLPQPRLSGILIALCCHHRCTHPLFVGSQVLSGDFSKDEFNLLWGLTSWATCGSGKPREPKEKSVKDVEAENDDPVDPHRVTEVLKNEHKDRYERLKLPREKREEIGRRTKRMLDYARAKFVEDKMGLEVKLYYYCEPEISLENTVLVAFRK